ncbi:odorant receptor 94b-like [Sabethes cyaneus]|uniref:odorant receptor 94b-like n=1 Tax=Sabethes cyaneus TaxID=53552 RepID=UPI00237D4FD8|nr:odorant receptor 94b-like [Sabethes cyaneus]
MYLSLTEIAMGVKTFYIFINFHTVYRLHQMAISKQFQPICEEELRPAQSLLSKVNFCFMAYFIWVFVTVATAVPSFFDEKYELPFFTWVLGIPYGSDMPYNFYCLWIYQISGLFMHGIFNVAAELQVGYLLTVARIQLDFLTRRFASLSRANETSQHRESFIECVQHYTVVEKFVRDFEHVFSKPMFAQFCASGASICATAYRLSSVNLSEDFSSVVTMTLYLLALMYQIFLQCYFGNEVTLKSEHLTHALYSAGWYKLVPRLRKDIQMMMIRSQRPIKLKAGGYIYCNLKSFTSTLNLAYSVFCVLQRRKQSIRYD